MENPEEQPIFSFDGLKRLLQSRGYIIDETKGPYTQIDPDDVTKEEIEKDIQAFKTIHEGCEMKENSKKLVIWVD